jgi:predicted Zn-dependent peptidase
MLKPIILKNGITVLRLPRPTSNVFLVGFVAITGSLSEYRQFPQGTSLIVEKMFWSGTDKHPSAKSLNLALESMGGQFQSLTSFELTQYYLTVPSYHQHKAISMLAEVMQNSYFDSYELENYKRKQVEIIKNIEEGWQPDPERLSLSNLYSNTGLGEQMEGTVDTVLSINQETIQNYLAHQYRPDKCFLVMAGNFDSKTGLELVEQEWNFWNPKTKKFLETEDLSEVQTSSFPRITYRQRGIGHTEVSLAFILEGGLQPEVLRNATEDSGNFDAKQMQEEILTDWSKLLVLSAVLGQGLSSRLWMKGVEEEFFFQNIESSIKLFRTTGFMQIAGVCENSQFTFALESVFSSLEALKKTTVSINELSKAKEYLKGKLILEQEDLLASTIWQINYLVGSGLTFELQDLLAKIDKVDAASLRALALDLFVPNRMSLTTVGPAKETKLVSKLIQKYLA